MYIAHICICLVTNNIHARKILLFKDIMNVIKIAKNFLIVSIQYIMMFTLNLILLFILLMIIG